MGDIDGEARASAGRPVNAELSPAIMDAALSLLAEGGYAGLTTAAVAKRAGVSTATLYRRWASKRELLLSAAEQIAESEIAEIDTGSTEGDLLALFAQKRRVLSGRTGSALAALSGESVRDPELSAVVRTSIFDPTREHLRTILAHAASRGERVTPDADAAAHLVVGAVLARLAVDGGAGATTILSEGDATLLVRAIAGDHAPGSGAE